MSLGPLHSGMLEAIFSHYDAESNGSIEFTISNAYKDLVYFKEEFGNQNPIVDLVLSSFEKAIAEGFGELSVGEVAKYGIRLEKTEADSYLIDVNESPYNAYRKLLRIQKRHSS